jgi:hypothetical protein
MATRQLLRFRACSGRQTRPAGGVLVLSTVRLHPVSYPPWVRPCGKQKSLAALKLTPPPAPLPPPPHLLQRLIQSCHAVGNRVKLSAVRVYECRGMRRRPLLPPHRLVPVGRPGAQHGSPAGHSSVGDSAAGLGWAAPGAKPMPGEIDGHTLAKKR